MYGQIAKAKAILEGSRRVAQNTPIQLDAARATEQFNSMVAHLNAPIPAGVFDVREVAMMVEKFIDCQFEVQEIEAEDPHPPRLLGLSAHDIAEVRRMAPYFPTGRALHGEIARLASLAR